MSRNRVSWTVVKHGNSAIKYSATGNLIWQRSADKRKGKA